MYNRQIKLLLFIKFSNAEIHATQYMHNLYMYMYIVYISYTVHVYIGYLMVVMPV